MSSTKKKHARVDGTVMDKFFACSVSIRLYCAPLDLHEPDTDNQFCLTKASLKLSVLFFHIFPLIQPQKSLNYL